MALDSLHQCQLATSAIFSSRLITRSPEVIKVKFSKMLYFFQNVTISESINGGRQQKKQLIVLELIFCQGVIRIDQTSTGRALEF